MFACVIESKKKLLFLASVKPEKEREHKTRRESDPGFVLARDCAVRLKWDPEKMGPHPGLHGEGMPT